jgi:hypothetical protein
MSERRRTARDNPRTTRVRTVKRTIIAAALLFAAVLNAQAAGHPYSDVSKPGTGTDFDTAGAYCDQKYGDDLRPAHKACMLARGWRLEKDECRFPGAAVGADGRCQRYE